MTLSYTKAIHHPRQSAFTLIELLVSMLILIIMMLAIVGLVSDSSRAMNLGYEQTYVDNNLRAMFDTLIDDMTQAVVSEKLPFCRYAIPTDSAKQTYDSSLVCHALRFSSLLGAVNSCSDNIQTVKWIVKQDDGTSYWSIKRGMTCGGNRTDIDTYPLLDHVVEFQIRLFDMVPDGDTWKEQEITDEELAYLPDFAEVYIMLASDTVHNQAMRLKEMGGDWLNHIRKNAKRHFFQVTFPMRKGRTALYDYPQ